MSIKDKIQEDAGALKNDSASQPIEYYDALNEEFGNADISGK
jgi:hypothetical protein